MYSVLADTGPLFALIDRSDQHHERAHRELVRLTSERKVLVVATSTLAESHRLILHRLGLRVAKRWFDQMTQGVGLLNPTTDDYLEAAARVHGFADQNISLHDGVVAILSQRLGYPIWSFDRHFDVMQASVWR